MNNQWSHHIDLFEQQGYKPPLTFPKINLGENYNNKLASTHSFQVLLPESNLYQVGETYEIQVKGKTFLYAICEAISVYPFSRISSFVSRIDRGMKLEEYQRQLQFEFRHLGSAENLKFYFMNMVIVKNKP
ncbi:hypothetical protein [Runella zeae]|uniref:hypothetical protein n=1 Tax=Runella zeae TaxID=94255 RepID=UPI00235723FC|nr:hypothetical protein [Runella zeae]